MRHHNIRVKNIAALTVRGFGSIIFRINDVAPGENQNGQENSAALICFSIKSNKTFVES